MRRINFIRTQDGSETATSQRLTIPNFGQERLGFWFKYNTYVDRWFFDFYLDDLPVFCGQRIVLNTNLLAPWGVGVGAVFAYDIEAKGNEPTYAAIHSGAVRLYHITQAEQVNLLYA